MKDDQDHPLGLIEGLSNEAYHAGPGLSSTGVKVLCRTPAHYYGKYLDPNRPPEKERAGQLEGTLAHAAIFEPHLLDQDYVQIPADAPRRPSVTQRNAKNPSDATIEAIAWWDTWEAENADRTIVTAEQIAVARAQAAAVRRVTQIQATLASGRPEVSAFWRDEETGILCKCRPDWIHSVERGDILVDAKTCGDAEPWAFGRHCHTKHYEVSAAWYSEGWKQATGRDVLAFVFIAIEAEYPYVSTAIMLDERSMEKGAVSCRMALNRMAECQRTGVWPGYSEAIEIVSLPSYALKGEE